MAQGIEKLEDCLKCSPGHFSNKSGATSSKDCIPCDAGMFAIVQGSTNCTACEGGKYAEATGASFCVTCTAGTYSGRKATECEICPRGKFSNPIIEVVEVVPVTSNTSNSTNITTRKSQRTQPLTECQVCPAGKYNNQDQSGFCLGIEGGKDYTEVGFAVSKSCPLFGADCKEDGKLKLKPEFFCMQNCDRMDETTLFFPCANKHACSNRTFFDLTDFTVSFGFSPAS